MSSEVVSEDQKRYYAGLYLLKMIDLKPEDGGITLEVPLDPRYQFIEDILDDLMNDNYITIEEKKNTYKLTPQGVNHIGKIIEEAETYIDQYDDEEVEDVIEELDKRNLDKLRVRFLWGLYTGEFDDVVQFQRQRGFSEIERDWAMFILSDDFYESLADDLELDDDDED